MRKHAPILSVNVSLNRERNSALTHAVPPAPRELLAPVTIRAVVHQVIARFLGFTNGGQRFGSPQTETHSDKQC